MRRGTLVEVRGPKHDGLDSDVVLRNNNQPSLHEVGWSYRKVSFFVQ